MEGGVIIAIILAGGTTLTGLITAIFHSTSLSRCRKIKCCCIECDRDVLSEDAYLNQQSQKQDIENN
jgi:hypothetical protein